VHQAVGTEAALRLAATVDPDLVVTELSMRHSNGATLMRRLRENGSRARFLVTTSPRTRQIRSLVASAGAVACLAKPVEPRLFVDVMLGLAPAVRPVPEVAPEPDAQAFKRAEEMYTSALPHRLASIATSAQEGNAAAVAAAAEVLAAASEHTGHADVAFVSHAFAEDARRGIVAHIRLMELVSLCARVDRGRPTVADQATSR
jgi:CheY-like chemotaxis protein